MTALDRARQSAAIGPLSSLPLFHQVAGRKAIVAGRSSGALWKAELLSAAGAEVVLLAGAGASAEECARFEERRVVGAITAYARGWSSDDLDGAAVAVADLEEVQAAQFAAAARAAGAAVNIVDRPHLSDFHFGSIVNRSPALVAISSGGAAPMLGQSIRARIESILPEGLAAWAKAAKAWRSRLTESLPDFAERRGFWQRFSAAAWAGTDRAPTDADFDALLAGGGRCSGRVILVGAGPGDPGLLTLNAVRALQSATVILHDHLVGPDVLELARREARRVAVGKSGHGPSCRQSDINEQMIALAQAGETVVRLKGGDPMIFGRASEEIAACRAAGIHVSAIPGISAAQGAAASLAVSLTERRLARRVQFVTGHGADGRLPADIDWISVADRKVTTVLYMPRKTLGEFARKALAKGLDPATPAIAVASASLPDEACVAGTIVNIDTLAGGLPAGAPVTVLIGWVGRRLVPASATVSQLQRAIAS